MKEIEFKVTIDEANLILEALGNLPFAKVYALVGKLQTQASAQLDQPEPLEADAAKAPEAAVSIGGGGKSGAD